MFKAVIYGASSTGRRVAKMIENDYDIIAFVDNDETKENTRVFDIPVFLPENLKNMDFDFIFPASLVGIDEICKDLETKGIEKAKICQEYSLLSVRSREYFLYRFAEMAYKGKMSGNVAEAGVFQGEFAKIINKTFKDKTLYLFDTFEGFSEKDIGQEKEESLTVANYMQNTSIDVVMKKMAYPDQCIIRKGYFPDTAENIGDEFCFVNLDMDLYLPILNGLRVFYPKMVHGGVILIHDYFSDSFPNVKLAVEDYEKENNISLHKMPIGDDISLAIVI